MVKLSYFKLCFFGLIMCACSPESSNVNNEHVAHELKHEYTIPDSEFGDIQSPINILTEKVDGVVKSKLNIDAHCNAVENKGHTVQLDFDSTSQLVFDDVTYNFKQLHFHTPSEHQIDGITYPMEMHMVNVLANDESDKPHYLVIGILFKMGKENPFINEFINRIPKDAHGIASVHDTEVNLEDLFGKYGCEEMKHYYHYSGSLTTAPYTETVSWHINQIIFEASAEQIQILNKIEGNNARHIQALKGRHVEKEDLMVTSKKF
ncbi:carbonic anhydrase family protein [Flammeovirga yaeyamensis]|uniref:Carbonic anhydrase n=1 Tax=Flammeovirga yaeyamensis TaxID=367791 RepID=A0AAX1NCM7_9BACT|nr:carbonic anhydrase family protein [Flammeovirga yaeyamensis]MBB3698750.1 carbonic anhydrase [Flammeovirga yaeyamensis]NMF37335.1 carbonic anhydrase family protein [Flammeovirga yaeyamensis]QWG03847.1 carbonic anhydrase family protein [Flammeovirga yaeyamensis]